MEKLSDGITIHRLGPSKGQGVMKVLRHLLWCINVLVFCLRYRADIVNCHSLPVLPIGVLIKFMTRCRLVYDAHELETETSWIAGWPKRLAKNLEKICMPAVDLLIVVSPGIENWYRQNLNPRAVTTVLNAPHYRVSPPRGRKFHDAFPIETGERVVLYQGNLAPHRGIEEILAALPMLKSRRLRVVFMGFGPLEEWLRANSADKGYFVHKAVSQAELLGYTASADVAVCLMQDTCLNHHLCLPNKLFEYVMARVPVVTSNVPEIRHVVEKYNIGVCIQRWDGEWMADAIAGVLARPEVELRSSLDTVASLYNWELQEDRMVAAYETYIFPRLKKN